MALPGHPEQPRGVDHPARVFEAEHRRDRALVQRGRLFRQQRAAHAGALCIDLAGRHLCGVGGGSDPALDQGVPRLAHSLSSGTLVAKTILVVSKVFRQLWPLRKSVAIGASLSSAYVFGAKKAAGLWWFEHFQCPAMR